VGNRAFAVARADARRVGKIARERP